MRFVAVKSEEQQTNALVFRTRDLLVRQRTQCINALRGHLAEYGHVFPQGISQLESINALIEDPATELPDAARPVLKVLSVTCQSLKTQLLGLEKEISRRSEADPDARRLMTITGIGSIAATAILALTPVAGSFKRGRDFAAWLGLTPVQRSTGGKQKLGSISLRGERTIRRLLILGATTVVRHVLMRKERADTWLDRMIERKPKMLITVALANKTARIVWALLIKGGVYRAPIAAA